MKDLSAKLGCEGEKWFCNRLGPFVNHMARGGRYNSLVACKCKNLPVTMGPVNGNSVPAEEIKFIDASAPVNELVVEQFAKELRPILQAAIKDVEDQE